MLGAPQYTSSARCTTRATASCALCCRYFNTSAFPDYPANLPAVWRRHFLGPARAAQGTLVVGEWGGVYRGDDEAWQDAFKAFLLEERLSSFYWALNPNSGDTGGVLLDDWVTPDSSATLRMRMRVHTTHSRNPSRGAQPPCAGASHGALWRMGYVNVHAPHVPGHARPHR